MKLSLRSLVLTGTFALCAGAAWAVPTCSNSIDVTSPVLSSGFSYDLRNTRNGVSTINSANVANLQVAHVNVGSSDTQERRGSPIVTQQTIYTTDGASVLAIDRASGCKYWSYKLAASLDLTFPTKVRSLAYVAPTAGKPALVLAGDNSRNFYALDAKSGALAWKSLIGTDSSMHRNTGTPQVYNGRIYMPVSSKEVLSAVFDVLTPCCKSHGMLQAMDAYTGKVIWSYHTTANPTLQWDLHQGPNGAPIWSSPALDTKRNSVYIGTGQNYTYPTTKTSDAIISLNADTGAVKWIFQAVKNDSWNTGCDLPAPLNATCDQPEGHDYDFGAAPVLTKTRNGSDILLAGNKAGTLYALNPDTGAVIWQRQLGAGSNLGGIHWGLAVDQDRVYASVADIYVKKLQSLSSLNFGQQTAANMALVEGGHPGGYAVDLMTGNVVWEVHDTHVFDDGNTYPSIYSASPTVTNDVVFFSTLDGVVFAYRSSDGAKLWSYNTAKAVTDPSGVAGQGGSTDQVGPYVAGNNLLVNSGYNTFGGRNAFQAGPGNALYVFKMPGTN